VVDLPTLEVVVRGQPITKGSHQTFNGKVVAHDPKGLKRWEGQVEAAARLAARRQGWVCPDKRTAVAVTQFYVVLPRPKKHYGTGKNAGVLRADAPTWVTERGANRGDIEKFMRSVFDPLTRAGVLYDDAQIVAVDGARKGFGSPVGVRLRLVAGVGPLW
jgi:crossover junction endodeoxyribonuclease RusA